MIENTSALLLIISIPVISSILWHFFEKKYMNALFGSTVMSVLILQIIIYIDLGYLDAFFIIAIFTTGIISLVVSFLIGLIFQKIRYS